jgi:hypothetical protein
VDRIRVISSRYYSCGVNAYGGSGERAGNAHDVNVRLFHANGSGTDTSEGGRAAENSETGAELSS